LQADFPPGIVQWEGAALNDGKAHPQRWGQTIPLRQKRKIPMLFAEMGRKVAADPTGPINKKKKKKR